MKAFIFKTSTFGDWELNKVFFIIIDENKKAAEKQFFDKIPDALPLKKKRKYFQNLIEVTEIKLDKKSLIELTRAYDE